MKFGTAMAVISLGLLLPLRAQESAPFLPPSPTLSAPSLSVWDAVYTLPQAVRGADSAALCVSCHGLDLEGDAAPALMGAAFTARWNRRTLGDLFERVKINFDSVNKSPTNKNDAKTDSESLSRQQSADFIAFVLFLNRYPRGDIELSSEIETLKRIRFVATKP